MSVEELMGIEVTTVSRRESTVGQSPAAIHVITQEDIRRSGATTIPELFRGVPGMDVARIDNNKWAVSVRGFNARFQDKLLVQMDGRTLYNPIFSGVYWDSVDYPLEDIERIEIIRGPGGSVWGANAVNGVINIITKPAKDTQGGLASGGGGTEEQGFGTFRYGGKLRDDLHYRVYGKGFTRDEQFSREGDPHDAWWGASGGMRLDWQASERDAVTFDGGYLRSDADRKDLRAMSTAPFSFVNIESEITDAGHLLGRWTREFDKENRFALQAYWDRFDRTANTWNLPRNIEFDLSGRFVDRLRGFNPGGAPGITDVIDDYISLDARLAWQPRKNLEISVVGQNLLDNRHPESGTSALVRSPLIEIQRSVYGQVVWRF